MSWEKIGVRICTLFRGGASSKAAKMATTVKPVVSKPATVVLTDSATGITTYKRPIIWGGKSANVTLETWFENGKRMSKMRIEGDGISTVNRAKAVTREQGGSLFGGDKIIIEKNDSKYWCYGERSKLVKEYNSAGQLEHKEYQITHDSGNGLNDWSHIAVQDRVYDEYPLTSSVSNMLTNPSQSEYFQHSLDAVNNYNKFAVKGTKYTRTIQANKEAAQKAEAEAAAKAAAEKSARDAEMAIRPRINVAKALGVDITELQRVEKTLADGSIERIYTRPGSDKVLLKTVDKGLLHQEWVYGGKADMIYMKQVGKDTPYIVARKGNSVQLSTTSDHALYYYDGQCSVEYNPKGFIMNGVVAQAKVPYKSYPDYVNASEEWKRVVDKSYSSASSKFAHESLTENGERVCHDLYRQRFDSRARLREPFERAKSNYLDLDDLFKPYSS